MQIKKAHLRKVLPLTLISMLMIALSCSEKYWPQLHADYENLLVVDGKITNEPGPYTILLSTSSPIEETDFQPLSNARIIISDDAGNNELLQETEAGVYQTNPGGIQGVIGRSYKISIEVGDKLYESAYEKLRSPIGVESLSAEWINKKGSTAAGNEYGYQFYLSTEMADDPLSFFYWEISETYHYQSLYLAYSIYWGTNNTGKSGFEILHKSDSLKNCWKTNLIDERYTYTTKNLTLPLIERFPINFTPNSIKFRFKYALQAKQYVISENAYAFLSSLQEQNDIENSLYTSQPFQIIGNIFNVNDPDEAVLGYFLTAGVSVSDPLLVQRPVGYNIPVDFGFCTELSSENTANVIEKVLNMSSRNWPIVLAANPTSETAQPMIVSPECVDCRVQGGVPERPDYWDNSLFLHQTNHQSK